MSRPSPSRPTLSILHVDLDAFFAAVEQRDRPELRGRPVVVGGGGPSDRGVVAAASYEARAFGIHSAMPLRTAAALCPAAIFVPVDGQAYGAASRQVMAILRTFTPRVEQVSIDEAFLDVAGSERLFGSAESIGRAIRAAILAQVGLTASVGVASTKLVAKIASDLRKPDALVVVPVSEEAAFLAPLPIERLWGVGRQTRTVLADYGVRTIGDLARLPEDVLVRRLGRHGAELIGRARGIDASPVEGGGDAKSIGHEHTFSVDLDDWQDLEAALLALSDGVAERLRSAALQASTVTVKVRDADFVTVTRQRTLDRPTDRTEPIFRAAVELCRPQVRDRRIRLLGVTASGLQAGGQLALFGEDADREGRSAAATAAVRDRFGDRSITRARLIGSEVARPFERDHQRTPERSSPERP
ncbi:MAG TPA: DNA polymerase IV [Candidatus Limnocylindrales bacterium]|nr:DNA polymerase IV [Candidatus Limnocylindrales bacterium]